MITVDVLRKYSNIRHGFFTREGGVSNGVYTSLNCGYGSDDVSENVKENRQRVASELEIENLQLVTCHQEHSATAITVDNVWQRNDAPVADGMATSTRGIALGILTADCAPILFADEHAGVIGAAHAGWKGALTGILEATMGCMVNLGASLVNIKPAIGPCIGQQSYEVGPEFYERFVEAREMNSEFFTPSLRDGHHMFDLAGYIEARLKDAGIAEIHRTGYDTCTDENLFYSYRRSVLQGAEDYGREISVIALAP